MAHVEKNVVTDGVSGMFGDKIVFRKRPGGGTILSSRPSHHSVPPTEAQEGIQEKFLEAIVYAKSVMANPELKAAYKAAARPGVSAYALALGDYMKDPVIKEVVTKGYAGNPGDRIIIRAIDNFKITEVSVSITKADGTPIEEGIAMKNPTGITWTYTAMASNPELQGSKVEVSVTDTPGHVVTSTVTL